ncbi:MAG: T9SS type A sorting domain-containing protein [Bacteroidales bacterium]|nr:T9SS type A sorting domain-containing protein [Bacteroidales bacterium]
MKKSLLFAAGLLLALNMQAGRASVAVIEFGENPAVQGFTVSGGSSDVSDGGYFYIISDGSGKATWTLDQDYCPKAGPDYDYTFQLGAARLKAITFNDGRPDNHVTATIYAVNDKGDTVTIPLGSLYSDEDTVNDILSDDSAVTGTFAYGDQIKEIRLEFSGLKEGDIVCPMWLLLASKWQTPQVTYKENAPNVTYINACDFDEPWINNRTAHYMEAGVKLGGNIPNGFRGMYDIDKYVDITTYGGGNNGYWAQPLSATPIQNPGWVSPYSAEYDNWSWHRQWDGAPCVIKESWDRSLTPYSGEYIDKTSNLVTLDQMIEFTGWWYEYTFETLDEGTDVGISLRCPLHPQPGAIFASGAAGIWADGLDRADGGFALDGFDYNTYNYVTQKLAFTYCVEIDGQVLEVNNTTYPEPLYPDANDSQGLYEANWPVLTDPTKWSDVPTLADGKKIFRPTCFAPEDTWNTEHTVWYPGNFWRLYYFDDAMEELSNTYPALKEYAKPDFTAENLSKGLHTIKVKGICGQSYMNEIKLTASKHGEGGVGSISADKAQNITRQGNTVSFAQASDWAIYSLNGALIANGNGSSTDISSLQKGMYLVKAGSSVAKIIR